jgi:hypothetical protein
VENPYQQVIKIMGRSLAPFASSSNGIPVYGFGDNESGDWGVFPLNGTTDAACKDLAEVLRFVLSFILLRSFKFRVYNEVTPTISLGGPTNFGPLIYEAIQICQRVQDVCFRTHFCYNQPCLVPYSGYYRRRSSNKRACNS